MTVTTVITAYNHEPFIAQAIESALSQRGDFAHEILVSDDGSTDGTRRIVRECEARHPGLVKDISPASNLGISGNLRHCFGRATGKYVAILEGDDYWTDPEKLRKQVAWMELHPDCPMVFSRIRLNRDGEMSLLDRHERLPERVALDDLIRCESMNPVCNFSCCLFRRDQLLKLPDVAYEGRLSEVTVAVFLAQVAPLGFLREVMSDYRIHSGGTFAGADEVHQCEQAVRTFQTTKKVIHWSCWPYMTRTIRRSEARLRLLRDRGNVRFSVITVTRQNLEGLRRTAASVAAQTCRDFEWIVVDGGSADGSREFLETLKPGTVRWVSEPDDGVYDAMNKGIGLSSGTYLIFMNAGDVFHSPTTLAEVGARALTADVVYGDWIRRSSKKAKRMRAPKTLPPFYFFRPACNICQQAMFVRGELLKADGFDPAYKVLGDLAKWRHCQMEGRSFEKVNVVVCDFEANVGLSERPSVQKTLDLVRLQSEFPPGLYEDAVRLGDYLRKHRLALNVSKGARRLAHWVLAPMRGIRR